MQVAFSTADGFGFYAASATLGGPASNMGRKWSRHSGHPGRGLLSRVESKIDQAQEEKNEEIE